MAPIPTKNGQTRRRTAIQLFDSAVAAVLPETLLRNALSLEGDILQIGGQRVTLRPTQQLHVFGSGKAAITMARAVEGVLGDRIAGGLVICSHFDPIPLRKIRVLAGAHPVPTEASVRATNTLWQAMTTLDEEDFFLFLLSGGSSALLELPMAPLTLEDLQQVTTLLLSRSVPIAEVNTVRKHLSRVKGGRLGAAVRAQGAVLVISDVIGDDLATIGSGPLYRDNTTFADARRVIEEHDLWQEIPATGRLIIKEGNKGLRPDTPKQENPRISHHMIGSNTHALEAAKQQAAVLGLPTHIMTSRLQGEARHVAQTLVAMARQIQTTGNPFVPPVALLFGGETTVAVTGSGRGGRNQELALAALQQLGATSGILLLAGGTDGIDGNSDAAGALADATIGRRATQQGLNPGAFLTNNDANTFFAAVDGLLVTGPTGTNVMDIIVLIIDPKEAA